MAEALLRNAFIQSGKTGHVVSSAGLGALVDHPADPVACQLIAEKGFDISAHRARQLTDEMIHQADLILVMEAWQKNAIETRAPSARGKVFRLGEWNKTDISDPYQKGVSEFTQALQLIEQGVAQWMARL
ncbi:low molecular weight protein-tyrosine-phosphatase Ptb [Nitrosomonas stercoris]|uniref:protein-tyrosine-phosphatase n=1 Tax=Nitrosomonas stercoris TaxID=1444684 RepID=A0A4Y1YPZ7_9PROT|nr:low molecular weight protein-tyrosine-phosphatase Ptb [Nitrosomonas stercoris]